MAHHVYVASSCDHKHSLKCLSFLIYIIDTSDRVHVAHWCPNSDSVTDIIQTQKYK